MKYLLSLLILLPLSSSAVDLQKEVRFSSASNLVYQLDCVSGALRNCSRNSYSHLWEKNFLTSDKDSALLELWKEIMEEHDVSLTLKNSKPSESDKSFSLYQKIRFASFQANNLEEYFGRLDLVTTPKTKADIERVVRHFYPSFSKWWIKVAYPKGRQFKWKSNNLIQSPKISKKIDLFAGFYEVALPPKYPIYINLFYRPDFENIKEPTSGELIDNYSVVEFLSSEQPNERIDVIIHELCHFLFASGPPKKKSSLKANFIDKGTLEARASYNLLNETLASTLGNGMMNKIVRPSKSWERYWKTERSFYNDSTIDKSAKAIFPWIEAELNKGLTLYSPGFAEKYTSLLNNALGNELTAPKLLLNALLLMSDSKYDKSFVDTIKRNLNPSSMFISEGQWSDQRFLRRFKAQTNLASLFLVHPSNIKKLATEKILSNSQLKALESAFKKDGKVVYASRRPSGAPVYVIIAKSPEEVVHELNNIFSLKKGFEGVMTAEAE